MRRKNNFHPSSAFLRYFLCLESVYHVDFRKLNACFVPPEKIVLNIFGGFKCTENGEFRPEINLFVNHFFHRQDLKSIKQNENLAYLAQ